MSIYGRVLIVDVTYGIALTGWILINYFTHGNYSKLHIASTSSPITRMHVLYYYYYSTKYFTSSSPLFSKGGGGAHAIRMGFLSNVSLLKGWMVKGVRWMEREEGEDGEGQWDVAKNAKISINIHTNNMTNKKT